MPIKFNSLLEQYGVSPDTVILLRHQDQSANRGRTPYEMWRDDRPAFELYQRIQSINSRPKFTRAKFWASFVVTHDGGTMFVGLYAATYNGLLTEDTPNPHNDGIALAEKHDCYALQIDQRFADLHGKLFIGWGDGKLAWVQRADNQNKEIVELRPEFKEPEFPGFLNFIESLSIIDALPTAWIAMLKQARGVYLLTCPKTKEQYVGKASGFEGFWNRWGQYASNNHGGNIALKSREYSDYQVSILEVAGSASTEEGILAMESRWKQKLQSREMGLNKN
jgi:hypothetical protein